MPIKLLFNRREKIRHQTSTPCHYYLKFKCTNKNHQAEVEIDPQYYLLTASARDAGSQWSYLGTLLYTK